MRRITKWLFQVLVVLTIPFSLSGADDTRLLRFPDINGNLVAFVYAGDIWVTGSSGGEARRLTSHEGLELFPRISPDGRWIAFSGEYSGNRQVFVIPSEGGIPRQLTWYNPVGVVPPRGGFDHVVLDWTPDSRQILIRANRTSFGDRNGRYFLVDLEGGLERPLQIVNGGFAALSPDGSKIVFTPVDREFRNWKRYKGGRASDLWIYDLKNNTSQQITNFEGTDQLPVWSGNSIYFASDRDLKLNIWKYDTGTHETKQVTFHDTYDVMWPSGHGNSLVYENGGSIYRLDLQTEKQEKLDISLNYDNSGLLPYFKNVAGNIHSFNVSPTGKRALFDARGDIFSVPAQNGQTENLTSTQGVREIFPAWSPDGRYISYYSDQTGEYELYLLENTKGSKPRQVTFNSEAWKYEPVWSPDSRYLLFSDRTLKLKLVETATGKITDIDKATVNEIRYYNFSPDSRWIAYQKEGSNEKAAIWVFDITAGKPYMLTDGLYSDYNPVFSLCGNYLFFVSDRDFNISFSSYDFDYIYDKSARIYAIPLTAATPKIFRDKTDTETVNEVSTPVESTRTAGNRKAKEATVASPDSEKKEVRTNIEFNRINERITALPGDPGEYELLGAAEGGLLFLSDDKLMQYVIEDEKNIEILPEADNAAISADGKMILYKSGPDYGIIKVAAGQKAGDGKVNLAGLEMKIDPRREWDQIFNDAWRIFRDYFYVDNLHGLDWPAIKQKYEALLPFVSHRFDLDYLLGEMVAESNTGHSYVDWGDFERVKRINNGLLGASVEADQASGRYRISDIYAGENWNPARRSPLTEQGVDVNEGDYIISIDGQDVTIKDNLYMFLENKSGRNVELTVNSRPVAEGARISTVKPVASETELFYFNWVKERREMVDRLSGGRIGYIHVPNTSVAGNRELYNGMYTYFDKEALIIDDRYNGGGYIPDRMADLLDRRTLVYWHQNGLMPSSAPAIAHDGPKVMLINGYSSSGGDAFPYFFKKMGLGKLIGTRTWGGLVGISGNARLVDGGYVSVPRFGVFDRDEGWIIEGVGVYPDIEVIDRPEDLASGKDPGIEKAVEELLKELGDRPAEKVTIPPSPDRSGWREGTEK